MVSVLSDIRGLASLWLTVVLHHLDDLVLKHAFDHRACYEVALAYIIGLFRGGPRFCEVFLIAFRNFVRLRVLMDTSFSVPLV